MRRYDDPVDVRRGQVAGAGGTTVLVEGPEQFLWRGRLWRVTAVVAHWVETGAWWQSSGVHAVLGADERADEGADGRADGQEAGTPRGGTDLAAEREVWRVEADRGMASVRGAADGEGRPGRGVFDLVFDWAEGSWRLSRCLD
jgi:hypothetical protein